MEARENRVFIERRLDASRIELARTEDSLRAYQEQVKMIIIPDQGSSGIGALSELYALKAKKEIELAILKKSVTPEDPAIVQLKLELGEINNKLESFPEIGMASLRLYRDVLIQQKIVEFLIPLHEQARVDEQKDVPVLLVLDRAVPAEKKTRPQRMLIVLTTILLTLFGTIGWVFFIERIPGQGGSPSPFERSIGRFSGKVLRLYRMGRPEKIDNQP